MKQNGSTIRTTTISAGEREAAFAMPKKPEVLEKQKLNVRYHVEDYDVSDRPRRFLEAFAAILKHSNYQLALDHYIRVSAKCSRCATTCQVYQATGDLKDIPCSRSELLLRVYRRHFTMGGMLKGRLLGKGYLTDEDIEEMAESFWNCTACRKWPWIPWMLARHAKAAATMCTFPRSCASVAALENASSAALRSPLKLWATPMTKSATVRKSFGPLNRYSPSSSSR